MSDISGAGAKLIRVSDDRQDRRRQHEAIDAWCEANGVTPAYTFQDAGSRDKAEDRQDFQRLLGLVRKRAVQWVVISEFDRFGFANVFELGGFLDTFVKNGCRLYDVNGTVWTSLHPNNVMQVFFKGMASPEEQKSKSTRILGQRLGSARRGEYAGGIPPYGYDVACLRGDEVKWRYVLLKAERHEAGRGKKGKLKGKFRLTGEVHFPDGRVEPCQKIPPHEIRREVLQLRPTILPGRLDALRRLFLLMDTTATNPNALARLYNEEGVPHYGPRWTDSIIRQLLQNPVHLGTPANGKRTHSRFTRMVDGRVVEVDAEADKKGVHQTVDREHWVMPERPIFNPVVDPERFARVQAKLAPTKKLRPVRSDLLWLSGLLHCARCSQPMYGQYMKSGFSKSSAASYLCSTRRSRGPDNPAGCRYHRIHHDVIEAALSRFFKERGQTIDDLLSVERDKGALARLLRERAEHDAEMRAILVRMKDYVASNLPAEGLEDRDGVICPDTMRSLGPGVPAWETLDGIGLVDLYDLISDHRSKSLTAEIARLESEHEALVERIAQVTAPLAVEKLNARLGELEARLGELKAQSEPLAERWETIRDGLQRLRERIAEAEVVLAVGTGRMKAEAVRGAVERIDATFLTLSDCRFGVPEAHQRG